MFLVGFKAVNAHSPDIASLMIYEQNGKTILLLKSSLTAFETEVQYLFGKDSYKTPEEFNELAKQLFQKKCFVVANEDSISFSNIQLQLGHETNLFAELDHMPKAIKTLHIKAAMFEDINNNKCELILTLTGIEQKQYIFDNSNQHEVSLEVKNNTWVIAEPNKAFYLNTSFLFTLLVTAIVVIVVAVVIKRKGAQ